MSNTIFDVQLQDSSTGTTLIGTGGAVYVTMAGLARKATLLNADTGAALPNPLTPTRGRIRFMVANTAGASPGSTSVDIYGMSGTGRCFVARGALSGSPTEIFVSSNSRFETLIVPFSILDTVANVETDTGFDLPVGSLIESPVAINVRTLEAARTINLGLLSTESGGAAAGLIAAASLAAVGVVKPTMAGTPTIGTLLRATVAANPVPEQALVSTSTSLSYTLSAGTVAADGFIIVPYQLTA